MDRATENSRRQHTELRRLADHLLVLVEDDRPLDESAVQRVLSRLAGVLKMHVAMELEGLYPQLLAHPNEEVRTMASRMVETVQGAYEGFLKFRTNWHAQAVHADQQTFAQQARFIAKAFHESTTREEQRLYDRVDAIYAEMARLSRPPISAVGE
ncbi:MAG: hypothetical protein OXU20_12010 [Myxococcales bacterium]|nr:hypothetical protein [Myxococcales bacterium]MDD9970971.1 hypothetical protein [Myxococcales bacterium]